MSLDAHSLHSIDRSVSIKLIIWDLDDTFWHGTLSEQGVQFLTENIVMIRQLTDRGIISSVCSNNDFSVAKEKLIEAGIWDLVVFPEIHWGPKGPSIERIIRRSRLRPENVLFVDDRPSNLQHASACCPGLKCLSVASDLGNYLDQPCLAGKIDSDRSQLAFFRILEQKSEQEESEELPTEDFLRQSEIKIKISYNVEDHLDRVFELMNRANQLNFTKSRANSSEERDRLKKQLESFGFKGGVVQVRDKYGDYGIAGFFLTLATLERYELRHFVFSCRVINMGVEQYIYELLNKPVIQIHEPVANSLSRYSSVDWIEECSEFESIKLRSFRIVLVGGCDMLQLSSYCSQHSKEFTNRPFGDLMTRFDEPSFFLASEQQITKSNVRPRLPLATLSDIRDFRTSVSESNVIVLSLYPLLTMSYFRGKDGIIFRLHPESLKALLASDDGVWFVRNCTYLDTSLEERLKYVVACVDSVAQYVNPKTKILLVGTKLCEQIDNQSELKKKQHYNQTIQLVARERENVEIIDVDKSVSDELVMDSVHFHRQGYLQIAQAIIDTTHSIDCESPSNTS